MYILEKVINYNNVCIYVCIYVFYLSSIILKILKFLKRRNEKNNYVCVVKYITTYTNYYTTRS